MRSEARRPYYEGSRFFRDFCFYVSDYTASCPSRREHQGLFCMKCFQLFILRSPIYSMMVNELEWVEKKAVISDVEAVRRVCMGGLIEISV